MLGSHRRIVESVTPDVFCSQVSNRFGLVLTDESIQGIASDLGWQDEWLITSKRRAKAPPPKSGDLAAMFASVPPPSHVAHVLPVRPQMVRSPGDLNAVTMVAWTYWYCFVLF